MLSHTPHTPMDCFLCHVSFATDLKMNPEIIGLISQQKHLILHCSHRGVKSSYVFCVLGSDGASELQNPL